MILKNVEVGLPLYPKKGQLIKKEEMTIAKERKKTDNMMESTAYCRRTLSKFFDGKINGLL